MHNNDSIDDMVTRFTKIINGLASLDDAIDNDYKVRKVISCSTIIIGGQSYNTKRAQWQEK